MSSHKNLQGLSTLLDFVRFTFLASAIIIICLQFYIIFKSEDPDWLDHLLEMASTWYMFMLFCLISWYKKKKFPAT